MVWPRPSWGCIFARATSLLLLCHLTASWSFDIREATISDIHHALFGGRTTCREIVSSFIARIQESNPTINAIISLNPEALFIADHLDDKILVGNVSGALFCIPVLLKDNFDAIGMNTTGGCRALADNKPLADAPTVRALRDAGAVILGKTNLHEMALEGLTVSSLGGQTANPYDLTRTPGGSSGGSGAAVAANLAVLATGTDTMNSLRSPASANSLFSFRPTRGLISRAGVIPVSFTQDAVGAMARNPRDLAVALAVMAGVGYDSRDNVTALVPPQVQHKDYAASMGTGRGSRLSGLRLGLLDGFFNHTESPETTPVNNVMADMISKLAASGATLVNITEPIYNPATIAALDVQAFEFRQSLDAYLSDSPNTAVNSFHDLYQSDPKRPFLVIPSQYPFIAKASHSSPLDAAYSTTLRRIQDLATSLADTFSTHRLDALIYPEQRNLVVQLGAPSQAGRNGILAALTGHPVVCVPAGFSPPSADAPAGVPVGMEMLGRPWSEGLLLNMADRIGELAPVRRMPPFASRAVEPKCYERVPDIKPEGGNIPDVYPIGVL
ncbi:hypothetical protein VTK26DRAFT_8034 [Humicola hyalothermophila]